VFTNKTPDGQVLLEGKEKYYFFVRKRRVEKLIFPESRGKVLIG